jgi:hypothetical protein
MSELRSDSSGERLCLPLPVRGCFPGRFEADGILCGDLPPGTVNPSS